MDEPKLDTKDIPESVDAESFVAGWWAAAHHWDDAYRAQGTQLSDALGLLGEVDLWITFPKVPDARAVKDKVREFVATVAAGRKGAP